jgi:23S rRNA (uridine2552-2'-O)-methyltransferase
VKKAQADGMRSRAAYKLEELVERGKLLRPGMVVVDLGAAPGGWSQVLRQSLRDRRGLDDGRVLALDILDMPPIAGVEFILGDFREPEPLAALEALLDGAPVDLVLSDMAPNMSGVDTVDQARAMHLAELARDFAAVHLKPGGDFLIKLFQGEGFDAYVADLRKGYTKLAIRKPAASRKRSNEVYALATGKRPDTKAMS